MSSTAYALPLRVPLKPSRRFSVVIWLAHGFAAVSVLAAALALAIKLSLLSLIAVSLCYYCKRYGGAGSLWPQYLLLKDEGKLQLHYADGSGIQARLLGDTYVHPWLVVLNVRLASGKRLALPLLTDSVSPDQHRQLRVYLHLQRHSTGRGAGSAHAQRPSERS